MKRISTHLATCTAAALLIVLSIAAPQTAWSAPQQSAVNVRLKSRVAVPAEMVRIETLADLSGGSAELRQRIGSLDVTLPPESGTVMEISRLRLAIRIQLAGIDRTAFHMTGAERVQVVTQDVLLNDKIVLQTLHEPVAKALRLDPSDVELKLTSPLPPEFSSTEFQRPTIRLVPHLPAILQRGNSRLHIGIHDGERLMKVVSVSVRIDTFGKVLTAVNPIVRGELFTPENVVLERQPHTSRRTDLADETIIGLAAARTIRRGELIYTRDATKPVPKKAEIVVRPRDLVVLTAKNKFLVVTYSGAQAMQAGAIGDVIEVRNPASGRVVRGRVVSGSEVQVEF